MSQGIKKETKLSPKQISRHFPKLIHGENFEFTSPPTDDYNCVAWAAEIDDEWIQFLYDANGQYDDSVSKYLNFFLQKGFELVDNPNYVEGEIKIGVYVDENNNFKHVARQIENGLWTSKIGDWEDISHINLDALSGGSYGNPKYYMKLKL